MSGGRPVPPPRAADFEAPIGRLLIRMTYIALAFLVAGVAAMAASGVDPLDGGPSLDPGTLVADVLMLRPAALLWLGFGIVLITPITRVIAAGTAYARRGQRQMAGVSIAILIVIAVGVAASLSTEI
jgi:uncharacterized membrane protein